MFSAPSQGRSRSLNSPVGFGSRLANWTWGGLAFQTCRRVSGASCAPRGSADSYAGVMPFSAPGVDKRARAGHQRRSRRSVAAHRPALRRARPCRRERRDVLLQGISSLSAPMGRSASRLHSSDPPGLGVISGRSGSRGAFLVRPGSGAELRRRGEKSTGTDAAPTAHHAARCSPVQGSCTHVGASPCLKSRRPPLRSALHRIIFDSGGFVT